MKIVLVRVLLALTLASTVLADGNSFKAVARDKDGNPIPGVTLSVLSGGNKFSAGVTGANGELSVPLALGNIPPNEKMQYVVRKCRHEDGRVTIEILILPADAQIPPQKNCDDYPAGFGPWPDHDGAVITVNVDVSTVPPKGGPGSAATSSATGAPAKGTPVRFEAGVYGGAGVINGNSNYKFLGDGAVLFYVGPILLGPELGGEFLPSTTIVSFGNKSGGSLGSTFGSNAVQLKNFRAGVRGGVSVRGFRFDADGGLLVSRMAIASTLGSCNATACSSTTTTTHDTVPGSYMGLQVSHTIFSYLEAVFGSSYDRLNDGSKADVQGNEAYGGLRFVFGGKSK